MDGVTLGKGSFASVELATHGLVNVKVSDSSSVTVSVIAIVVIIIW